MTETKKKTPGRLSITGWVQEVLYTHVAAAKLCVDATAGKGNDTLFLCQSSREDAAVWAFDIQEAAIAETGRLLEQHGCSARLICDGHENMDAYLELGTVDVIMFNLGYLPGGDHALATKAETTLCAIEKSLQLVRPGGIVSVCIYSGGDSGFAEKDAVLSFLKELDPRTYTVIVSAFYNKPNHPPIPVIIRRER